MTADHTPEGLDLTRLREVAEAVGEGPWESYMLPDAGPNRWTMTGVGVAGDDMGHRIEAMFPADAEHVATFDPPTVLTLLDTLAALRAECGVLREQTARVEAAHYEAYPGAGWCGGCHDAHARESWPCPTIAAIHPGA